MKLDVKKNAKRNIATGIVNKLVLLVLPFFSRTIINYTLGSNFLGLNSLFSSLLTVLSLSELGFSSAMVYHMYKPIAENDKETLNALLNLYRRVYTCIGLVISLLGLLIIPFLRIIIKEDCPANINIYVVYLIQLFNTAISYFMYGYKQSLLVAYQRDDIYQIVNLLTQITLQSCQITFLIFTRNYYYYVLCLPVCTIVNNLCIAYFTNKLYPELRGAGKLNEDTLRSIKKLVAGSFIQKTCDTTRNSLDSICISAFISLVITGMYNNYYLIFNGVNLLLVTLSGSIMGGIGNHVATKSKEENFLELKKLDLLYMFVSGWCAVCLLCLAQTFMEIWMGKNMLLPVSSLISMCIYFYVLKLGDMRSLYYAATGIWWEMRYRSIVETISNVILNFVLGKMYGLNGIIWATTISLLLFNFPWGTHIVFKHYFGTKKIPQYYWYHIKCAVITLVVCIVTYNVTNRIHILSPFASLIIKGGLCVIVGGGLMAVLSCTNKLFIPAIKMVIGKD